MAQARRSPQQKAPSPSATSPSRARKKHLPRRSPPKNRRAPGASRNLSSTSHAPHASLSSPPDLRSVLAPLHPNLRRLPSRSYLAQKDRMPNPSTDTTQVGSKRKRVASANENAVMNSRSTRGRSKRLKGSSGSAHGVGTDDEDEETSSMEVDTPTWTVSDESEPEEEEEDDDHDDDDDSTDDYLLNSAPVRQLQRLRKDEPKPTISEFKARRLVSAFNATTPRPTSVENFTVPVSGVRTLQNAIREGKLTDDNKLVGADDNSDDEDYEGAEELKELLRKGEIYNLGPEGNPILHTVPPSHSSLTQDAPKSTSSPLNQNTLPPPKVANPNAVSRFKASRSQAGRPSPASAPSTSSSGPALSSNVIERQAPSTKAQNQMIIESPSFQRPVNAPPVANTSAKVINPTAPPAGPFPMIVESPSFPRSQGPPAVGQDRPAVAERIKESTPTPRVMSSEVRERSRPSRPPIVVAARVKESHPPATTTTVDQATPSSNATSEANPTNPPKKISRFKAERT